MERNCPKEDRLKDIKPIFPLTKHLLDVKYLPVTVLGIGYKKL